MDAICQKCGDIGFPELLVCCFKCNDAYEHRYCFDDASIIFKSDVKWACQDCLARTAKQPVIPKPDNLPLRRSDRVGSRNVKSSKAKIRSEGVEQVPSVVGEKEEHRGKSSSSIPEIKLPVSLGSIDLLKNGCTMNEENRDIQNGFADKASDPGQKNEVNLENGYASKQAFAVEAVPNGLSNSLTDSCYIPAQPIADPIWKGSFNILDGTFGLVGGAVAHLSSKACLKVREEACLLPAVLNSQILPKASVWPKSFEQEKPSDDSIGLYFFPEAERDEKVFNSLVDEMMSHDLAIKCVVENAELLVFTSIELPIGYWRFQGNHYLWGVFRAKQPSRALSGASQ
ncbi:hypothetical protein Ancab_038523 [Ancistrocladus abbreviatus]